MSKPRGRPFQPGNKFGQGRPKGSRNKTTSAGRRLLEQHHEPLMAKQLQAAYQGDPKARQWCLEQVLRNPAQAGKLKLPAMQTVDDLGKAYDAILHAVSNGERTAAEGVALMDMVEEKRKLIETQQLAPRIEELERLVKSRQGR